MGVSAEDEDSISSSSKLHMPLELRLGHLELVVCRGCYSDNHERAQALNKCEDLCMSTHWLNEKGRGRL